MYSESDGRWAFHQIGCKPLGLEHRFAYTPDRQRNIEQSLGRLILQAIFLIATQEKGEAVGRYSPEVRMGSLMLTEPAGLHISGQPALDKTIDRIGLDSPARWKPKRRPAGMTHNATPE